MKNILTKIGDQCERLGSRSEYIVGLVYGSALALLLTAGALGASAITKQVKSRNNIYAPRTPIEQKHEVITKSNIDYTQEVKKGNFYFSGLFAKNATLPIGNYQIETDVHGNNLITPIKLDK